MTDNPKSTFAKRVRAARPRAGTYNVWDDVISGLGLRVGTSGHRAFFLRRSVRGRIRSATIGNADAMTVPEARAEARKLLATFIEPARKDNGPRTPGHPMAAFAGEFLDRQARHWKPRTLETNTYMVRKYILPAFDHLTVDGIAVEHVRDWFASLAERPGSANRAMPVLSVMMRMAELWGYRPHNSNPCKKTRRYRTEPRERFLSAGRDGPAQRRSLPRRVLLPASRRHHPPADADRMPRRRSRLPRMGLDQGQAHPPSRFKVRAAHGLAVERRARDH